MAKPIMMLARVDKNQVSIHALWWPAMNFNQFHEDGTIGVYEFEFQRPDFIDLMEPIYQQCIQELQADDTLVPDQTFSPLREVDYPPLNMLIDQSAAFLEALGTYLWDDLLSKCIPSPFTAEACFMINSIESVSTTSNVVIVSGRGYHAPRSQ